MIAIIDYGMGNLGSIANMLKKIGADAVITNDAAIIRKAQKLVLPGVGSFNGGMRNLNNSGLVPILSEKVREEKLPVLGICLGMHLLTEGSEEGDLPGLGWIKGKTLKFRFDESDQSLKIPHMGWNSVSLKKQGGMFQDMHEDPRFYFVHSYYVQCSDEADVVATTHHGHSFTSAVGHGNILGTQFHPEKSHKFGMKVFQNFVNL